MDLGNNILNYRKKENLSQEDLARKVGVTRQTISKWELNETSPDLKQSIKLAKIFNISLDELTNNIKENKKEKITSIKKTSKVIAFIFYIILLIFIIETIAIAFYSFGYNYHNGTSSIAIVCTLDKEEYAFAITYDDTHDIIMTEGSPYIFNNIYKSKKYKNAIDLITDINNYFKERDGICE